MGYGCDFRPQKDRQTTQLQAWSNWIPEDLSSHLFQWLRPDFVPLAPHLVCKPDDSPNGSGILVQSALIFVKLGWSISAVKDIQWLLWRLLGEFVGDHLPQEAILDMPILTGEDLHDAAMAKKSTAGGFAQHVVHYT